MEQLQQLMSMMNAGCSALSWKTQDGKHLWGRNMDFNRLAQGSKISFIPRGTSYYMRGTTMENNLREQERRTSAYAAVGTGFLMIPSTPVLYEGINEKGLMGGQLYYREFAHFEQQVWEGTTALLPPFVVYHMLAQCDSVQQVVDTLQQQVTLLHEPMLGTVPSLHWAFSDSTGEMAVIEPDVDGLHIYRSTVGVMTNSPGYPWHRTNLLNYVGLRDLDYDEWELEDNRLSQCFSGSGMQGLPGDWSSPSRFVRLAMLKKFGVKGQDEAHGVANMMHLFQSAAFPNGMVRVSQEGHLTEYDVEVIPYDYTIYTSVMCAESKRFYWTSYENQRVQYVDLEQLKSRTQPVQFELGREPDFLCVTPQE